MLRNVITALLLLSCAGLLSACATPGVETVRYLRPQIPESLRSCAPAPEVPGSGSTQRDVARYVVQLSDAGQDCRVRLRALSDLHIQ